MLFTYKDKGPATVFAYRSNQRPMTKYNSISNIPGKPNPIKQWRKQLQPSVGSTVESHPTINDLDKSTRTQIESICKSYNEHHCMIYIQILPRSLLICLNHL